MLEPMGGAQLAEYVSGRPHRALSRHVLRYGGYREYSSVPVRRRQVPTTTYTLILSFGPALRLDGPAGPSIPSSFLAGMHDKPVVTEFCGVQHGMQVDLTPLGVFELLGRSLTNVTPRLDELEVRELAGLPERLGEDPGWPQRFARVDAALLARLDAVRVHPDPEVAWAWRRLLVTGGRVGVQELASDVGWSRRHLLTRFQTQVGLAPKLAARVVRLERATGMLVPIAASGGPGSVERRPLADVAADCGFSDHAHLVREFHALAGCTPSEYLDGWS